MGHTMIKKFLRLLLVLFLLTPSIEINLFGADLPEENIDTPPVEVAAGEDTPVASGAEESFSPYDREEEDDDDDDDDEEETFAERVADAWNAARMFAKLKYKKYGFWRGSGEILKTAGSGIASAAKENPKTTAVAAGLVLTPFGIWGVKSLRKRLKTNQSDNSQE